MSTNDDDSGWHFKVGDAVVYSPPEHMASDAGWCGLYIAPGAVGRVAALGQSGLYQYGVEFRYGPLVARRNPLQSQLRAASPEEVVWAVNAGMEQ